ncbi:hypothetical protein IMG5_004650, partial [Ichthyophthirius multifiliis]
MISIIQQIYQVIIEDTQITQNTALKGGGLVSLGGDAFLKGTSQIVNNISTSQQFNNIQSNPQALKIYLQKNKEIIELTQKNDKGQFIITNWASGQQENNGSFIVKFLDQENGQEVDFPTTEDAIFSLDEDNDASANIKGTFNARYSEKYQGFYFNKIIFDLYPKYEKGLSVKITCDAIKIPIYNSQSKYVTYKQDYDVKINIKMRGCIRGEIYLESSRECHYCQAGKYSIIENSKFCKECPNVGVIQCPGGSEIQLNSGYFRRIPESDIIEECKNLIENCVGGYEAGNNSCALGHIGALCESCDIYGIQWGESWSNSAQFKCGKCSEISGNAIKMFFISLYTLIAILFSVKSTMIVIENYILAYYLQRIGLISNSVIIGNQIGILIKIFTNHVQLIYVLATFDLQLPSVIGGIINNVGNPIQQMIFSTDCYLLSITTSVKIIYARLIWSLLLPFGYIGCFLIFYLAILQIKKIRIQQTVIWITCIYMFISIQPSIISQYISTISCRTIVGLQYIKADVSYECYTDEHNKWMLTFILPILFIWVFGIPAYFISNLYRNRTNLDKLKIKYKFGFLYHEYKKESYFWELIKIFEKTLVIIFLNIYDSYIIIKGILVLLIIFNYYILSLNFQPYQNIIFNNIDKLSSQVVLISIILALFAYKNYFEYFIWIAYILIAYINLYFLFKMILVLMNGYLIKYQQQLFNIYQKINLKLPKLSRLLK